MIPTESYLFLSLALFTIGVVGVLTRRNVIIMLMSIELILNAVNINLVAFSRQLRLCRWPGVRDFHHHGRGRRSRCGPRNHPGVFPQSRNGARGRNGHAEMVKIAAMTSQLPFFLAAHLADPDVSARTAAVMLFFGRKLQNNMINVLCVGQRFHLVHFFRRRSFLQLLSLPAG